MTHTVWRGWCMDCDWTGDWLDDQDDAYRDSSAHEHYTPGDPVLLAERETGESDAYVPDDEDIFIAYRFMSLGLMRDPDDKPYDPKATTQADDEYNRWLSAHDARVRREVMTNLPPHISIVVHSCEAREGGGVYCSREKGHPGDHKILGVPAWSYQDKLDEYLDTYCSEK